MFEALLTAALFLARFEPATSAANTAAKAVVLAPATTEEWGQVQTTPCEDLEATDWSCPKDFSPRVRGSNRKPRQENGTFG